MYYFICIYISHCFIFKLISLPHLFREIEFRLHFGCRDSTISGTDSDDNCNDSPTLIDQGVRLEVRSQVLDSSNIWFPIRYYTPSRVVPSTYLSLVVLNSSNITVRAQASIYNSTFPLLHVNSNQTLLIREYICGPLVQNFTELIQLRCAQVQLRLMQRFGRRANSDDEATWFLNDINTRFWNGENFLPVLHQNFSRIPDDDIRLGNVTSDPYGLEIGEVLLFSGITMSDTNRRSVILRMLGNGNLESCEDQGNSKL